MIRPLRLALIALAMVLPASCLLAQAVTPPPSTYITSFAEESLPSVQMTYPSQTQIGDLWPSCWSNDGNLYAANGDGTAFNGNGNSQTTIYDMAISRITGNPAANPAVALAGTTVSYEVNPSYTTPASANQAIGVNYTGDNSRFNDKPTGMLCVSGNIYLAYQNLGTSAANFTGAPAATVLRSTDHGQTWSAPPATPMFGTSNPNTAGVFTTIFFLDMGEDPLATSSPAPTYIYAYGLDNNWTAQTKLFMARIPYNVGGTLTSGNLLNAAAWQFYSGVDGNNNPLWNATVNNKVAVLTDTRSLYNSITTQSMANCPSGSASPGSETVIAQGGVTYDAPLNRYIFSTWSCATHEFYDAPNPWGPWTHIATGGTNGSQAAASKDFGVLIAAGNRGQYATTIPSKFISPDGQTVYLQSNVAEPVRGQAGNQDGYTFSLRKVFLERPAANPAATNSMSTTNLATMPNTLALSKSTHYGQLCALNCADILAGTAAGSEDDYDDENKVADNLQSYWGYTWPQQYNLNKVVYTTGSQFPDGGWFASGLTVQLRQNGVWVNASGVVPTPAYPYSTAANPHNTYTFTFSQAAADGVRIIGNVPASNGNFTSNYFTSISNLGVYFNNGTGNVVADPGFENQTTATISTPWGTEGPDAHGIDLNKGFAHTGANDVWIRDSTTNWNSVTQVINVTPNTNYTLTAWIRNNFPSGSVGYIGVRQGTSTAVYQQTTFGALPSYGRTAPVTFNSGSYSTMTLYIGFVGTGQDQYIQVDDVAVQ